MNAYKTIPTYNSEAQTLWPWENLYKGISYPYLDPSQSVYRMAVNRKVHLTDRVGDYSVRQVNDFQIPATYPYPLDNRCENNTFRRR